MWPSSGTHGPGLLTRHRPGHVGSACLSASPLGLLLWFLTSRNGVLQGVFMATAHCCGARSARGCIPRTTSLLCSECLVLLVLPGLPGTQQRESTPAEPGAPQCLALGSCHELLLCSLSVSHLLVCCPVVAAAGWAGRGQELS